jgi:uncharacterized protein
MQLERTDKQLFPASPLQAINISKGGIIIAARVELAVTSAQRRRGLLGRDTLGLEEGLYLTPCEWIQTFRMRFPIDVAFLSDNGFILAVHHNLRPNRLSKIILRADGILELSAGRLMNTGTAVGDIIQFQNSKVTANHPSESYKAIS